MVIGEALVTPHQNLFALVSVGSITADSITSSGETREGKSRGSHCWIGWIIS